MREPQVALTIAGSDSGGGAGIQADLRAFTMHGVFGASVVTALTAQNTVGVHGVAATATEFVAAQLDAVLNDLPVVAVKTGMLATPSTVELVAAYAPRLPGLVVDPVLVATSGDPLFTGDVATAYREKLFPHATVVTPNLHEAGVLLDRKVSTVDDMRAAAEDLAATGARCVVVKGGHLPGTDAVDVVWLDGVVSELTAPWVNTRNTHGTGCTFASATAALLAKGASVREALTGAKTYVNESLRRSAAWRLGAGSGPVGWPD
ncbi:bifunctional hydroxymethylpyrimidine kinase/phosphomethylpyrimidine kinase [Virgisporangium ochraceum]|uniref:Hydroxymethylpyrimidine/phosphomethylpyrimidine kinase n=1 Tax=Virgisporangium ochraceum TaxID=65505 RepID=A0A8J4A7U6_9ACTN|nr:bifunctional hydroxymethylpyrimidine kinase/phosphomethylpyrimidine kinase [Virgisporangium ochraceum]GIJ74960.1 hydroxymethylpyrimidine/phosphomethylpyrimidine kinase [Virgisporangium ochraceum]